MKISQVIIFFFKCALYILNGGGLIWWAFRSVQEYNTWKTASNVVLQYGDDGNGNVRFPVVTICPWVSKLGNISNNFLWKQQSPCKEVGLL